MKSLVMLALIFWLLTNMNAAGRLGPYPTFAACVTDGNTLQRQLVTWHCEQGA